MRTKLSTCLRKTQFLSRAGAERFAYSRCLKQEPYRCDKCKRWHLTSRARPGSSPDRAETGTGSGSEASRAG